MDKQQEPQQIQLPKKISWGKILVGAAIVTAVTVAAVFGMGGPDAITSASQAFGETGKLVASFIQEHVGDAAKAVAEFAGKNANYIVGAAAGTAVVGSFTKQLLEKRAAERELLAQFTR